MVGWFVGYMQNINEKLFNCHHMCLCKSIISRPGLLITFPKQRPQNKGSVYKKQKYNNSTNHKK